MDPSTLRLRIGSENRFHTMSNSSPEEPDCGSCFAPPPVASLSGGI
jgi:hypothetical protein